MPRDDSARRTRIRLLNEFQRFVHGNVLRMKLPCWALFIFIVPSAAFGAARCQFAYSNVQISTPRPFTVEVYKPPSPWGVVLLVHGSAGVYTIGNPPRDNMGEQTFVCAGLVVLLPHYFDVSGIKSATSLEVVRKDFNLWSTVLREVITRYKPSKALFVIGESLGGFLAIDLLTSGTRAAAASLISSGLPPELSSRNLSLLPPLLLQHGDQDQIVPLSFSTKLRDAQKSLGKDVKLVIYNNRHHDLSESMKDVVVAEELAFFKTHRRRLEVK